MIAIQQISPQVHCDRTCRSHVTVVIIEDMVMFHGLLRSVCEKALSYDVIGGAGTIAEGFQLCRHHHPDLILLDLDLPDGNALDALSDFRAASPDARILAVSVLIDERTMWRVAGSGLDGFVDKSCPRNR